MNAPSVSTEQAPPPQRRARLGRVDARSPFTSYLKEINAFPLLSSVLEGELAAMRDDSNQMTVEMAGMLLPHVERHLTEQSPVGEALRSRLEELKTFVMSRWEGGHVEGAYVAFERMLAIARRSNGKTEVEPPAQDDAEFLRRVFQSFPQLQTFANRICTSEDEEIGAVVATLRQAFDSFSSAFPPGHPAYFGIMQRRDQFYNDYMCNMDPNKRKLAKYLSGCIDEGNLSEDINEHTARQVLTGANLRLVVSIARTVGAGRWTLEDRINEGNMGLIRAVDAFDPGQNTRFSTFASYWIKQSIKRGIVNREKSVRIPAYLVELLGKWNRAKSQLHSESGSEPTPAEIAEALEIPKKKMKLVRKALAIAFNQPSHVEKTQMADYHHPDWIWEVEDPIPDSATDAMDVEWQSHVLKQIEHLDPREQMIVNLRFGLGGEEPRTLKEIGELLGLTRERVRQVEATALQVMRTCAEAGHRFPNGKSIASAEQDDLSVDSASAKLSAVVALTERLRERLRYRLRILDEGDAAYKKGELQELLEKENIKMSLFHHWQDMRLQMEEALREDPASLYTDDAEQASVVG